MQTCQMTALLLTAHQYLRSWAALGYLIRLFSIQEVSWALKCSQYYAFNSFPTEQQRDREERKRWKVRGKQKDPWGRREISEDKSLPLDSCHDSLDNHRRYPALKTRLKACSIPLPSEFSGCGSTVPSPAGCPRTPLCWIRLSVPWAEFIENIPMHPISM